MDAALALRLTGLFCAGAAVALGSYGLLLQIAKSGLWPLDPTGTRPWHRALGSRLGELAARRGWFAPIRARAPQDLGRAREIGVTADDLVGECLLYAVAGALGGWLFTIALGGAVWNVIPAALAAAILFHVPVWSVRSRADRRVTRVTRRLPYSLEVIVLAGEAGATFEEALEILVREEPHEPLHEEFDQVLRDMQLGLTRREALQAMAARVATEDVGTLVMELSLAEDLGTPIASTLRKQADAIRGNRLHRAERLAREAGPKMALPNTMIMVANVLLILAPFLPKLSITGD
jgi:tight adherence protein C